MSAKERRRLMVLARIKGQGMSIRAASETLHLSYRQTRRIYARYSAEGDRGLVHRSRGRPSNRGFDPALKAAVIARYKERYPGFGPTLAAEKLTEDGLILDHETLRRWLLSAGIISRRRKRSAHRSARVRRAHFGELVQLDGSHHGWFEERGPKSCLMEMVDDATGMRLALMSAEETTFDAMRLLWTWIDLHGVPEALYTDKKSVYVPDREPTIEEELAGVEPLTAFGLACATLGIAIIPAHSPEAKGRVERAHGVFQDRFVKELRLEGASTIEEANLVLAGGFTENLNEKFAVLPASEKDRHRPLKKSEDLAGILSVRETRTVTNDFTLRHHGRILQITKQRSLPRPGTKVQVASHLDGSLHIALGRKEFVYQDVTDKLRLARADTAHNAPARLRRVERPAADHPWQVSTNRKLAARAVASSRMRYS